MLNERVIGSQGLWISVCQNGRNDLLFDLKGDFILFFCGTQIKIILLQLQWDIFSQMESKGEILLVREKQQPVPSTTEPSVPFMVSLSKPGRGVMISTGIWQQLACVKPWHLQDLYCRGSCSHTSSLLMWNLGAYSIGITIKNFEESQGK